MKKIIAAAVIAAAFIPAYATTLFTPSGILLGTVCRAGVYYTDYNGVAALPVGSSCAVRAGGNPFGPIIGWGVVTTE